MKIESEHILTSHGVHPTALRMLIYETIEAFDAPFTLYEVEAVLDTMDTSTIFRCLRLFQEKELIHEIDDGGKSQKYCVCRCHDDRHSSHLHFTCLWCHKTYCVKEISVPVQQLPAGFSVSEISLVAKGLCPDCTKKI